MASRLYPGNRGPRGVFNESYKVYSFASIGRADLEHGDKLILPSGMRTVIGGAYVMPASRMTICLYRWCECMFVL